MALLWLHKPAAVGLSVVVAKIQYSGIRTKWRQPSQVCFEIFQINALI